MPADMRYRFTGEIEEQEENMSFLSSALLYALFLILVLLVLQFNSVSKPFIILFSIFMSFTGVFLGLVVFQYDFCHHHDHDGDYLLGGNCCQQQCGAFRLHPIFARPKT